MKTMKTIDLKKFLTKTFNIVAKLLIDHRILLV